MKNETAQLDLLFEARKIIQEGFFVMSIRNLSLFVSLGLCLFQLGCTSVPIRKQFTPGLQSGSQILGEVVTLVPLKDLSDNSLLPKLKKDLLASGIPESELSDGSEVIVFSYSYAHNSSVGLKYGGRYLAHVTPEQRDTIKVGDIVAITVNFNSENRPVGSVVRVYGGRTDPDLDCEYHHLNYEGLASLSPYGPPIGVWLECKGITEDGWVRRCVPGAPPPGPYGDQQLCVSELQKAPSGN